METFYIASSRDRLNEVIILAKHLESIGLHNAFPWPEHFNHKCSTEVCGVPDRKALARFELDAASNCDLFIGIARLGKGSHVELGAALAGRPKAIFLVGVDPKDLVFYEGDGVDIMASLDDLMQAIVEWEVSNAVPQQ